MVAPVVVLVLDGAARSSDSEKVTGNGHPLEEPALEEAELARAAVRSGGQRDRADAVDPAECDHGGGTADWLAAQPEIWMGWAVGAGALVAAAAASAADGEVACSELSAASAASLRRSG